MNHFFEIFFFGKDAQCLFKDCFGGYREELRLDLYSQTELGTLRRAITATMAPSQKYLIYILSVDIDNKNSPIKIVF